LKISSGQQSQWEAFGTVYRGLGVGADDSDDDRQMGDMQSGHRGDGSGMRDHGALPERMAMHEKMMEMRLAEMKKAHAAMGALYGALGNDQKKMADELLPAFMMCRMKM